MFDKVEFFSLRNFVFIAIFLQLIRLCCLYINLHFVDLFVDEVYYWGWAQHLDFGYYSKPPVVAWVIWITTTILGDTELATKIGAIFIYPITSIVIYLIAKRLFADDKIAFFSALAFLTLPAISLSSMIISTDVVLLLFWSLAMYFFIKALQENTTSAWIYAGVFAGFGLLSKYHMIFFLVSVILLLITNKKYRVYFYSKNLYLAIVAAFLIFLPNLYWQYTHDFVSFVHTKEISQIDRELFNLKNMFAFLGSQLIVFGPIFFATLLFLLFNKKYFKTNTSTKLLYFFILPLFIFIVILSLLSRAFANWGAPIYVASTILVVAYLITNNKIRLVVYSIILHLALSMILYFYYPLANLFNIELTRKTDPYKRVVGWELLSKEVATINNEYKLKLLFDDREMMAEMIYYIKPHPFDSLIFNPNKEVKNQYHLDNSLNNKSIGQTFMYVTNRGDASSLASYFENTSHIKHIKVQLYKDFSRDYDVYIVGKYKGEK